MKRQDLCHQQPLRQQALIGSTKRFIKGGDFQISDWKKKFKSGGCEVGTVLKVYYKNGSTTEGKFVGFVPGTIPGAQYFEMPGIVILTKINGDYPTDDVWNLYVVFEDIDNIILNSDMKMKGIWKNARRRRSDR